jgi:hypothetical protein
MTETSEIVKRLRVPSLVPGGLRSQAADRLEVLEAENKRLREALGWFLEDGRFQVGVGGNPIAVEKMISAARAALKGET